MVFDVNDFDEAYLGRFTWDLQRFAASLALVGWQKALPEDDVRRLIGRYVRAYLSQVDHYRGTDDDEDFALHLENTSGPVYDALVEARLQRRADLLDLNTVLHEGVRMFREEASMRKLSQDRAGQGGQGVRGLPARRSPSTSGRPRSCSTTCATWWRSPGSASAAPASRRTTCSSRATARRSTTTSCSR